MTILWGFEKNHPEQLSAYETQSWVKFSPAKSRAAGTRSDLQHFPFLIAAHLFHAPDLIVGKLLYFLERSLLLIL